jgi:hypothetical protein
MFTSFAVCLQEEHHLLNHLLTHVIYHVSFLLELFISRSWHENAKLLLLLNSYPTCEKTLIIILIYDFILLNKRNVILTSFWLSNNYFYTILPQLNFLLFYCFTYFA